METAMKYYIQSGWVGNCLSFWRQGRAGYTTNVDEAHEFTEEEAKRVCAHVNKENVAWPVGHIRANLRQVANSSDLDHSHKTDFKRQGTK